MIAANMRASSAPRFLLSLVTLRPGEHLITIDHEEVDADDKQAWVLISNDDEPRIRLSFPSNFKDAHLAIPQANSIWHHYLIQGETFHEAKTLEETLPDTFDYSVDLSTLAANEDAIEDLCDACALQRSDTMRNTPAPEPHQSEPPFTTA